VKKSENATANCWQASIIKVPQNRYIYIYEFTTPTDMKQ